MRSKANRLLTERDGQPGFSCLPKTPPSLKDDAINLTAIFPAASTKSRKLSRLHLEVDVLAHAGARMRCRLQAPKIIRAVLWLVITGSVCEKLAAFPN